MRFYGTFFVRRIWWFLSLKMKIRKLQTDVRTDNRATSLTILQCKSAKYLFSLSHSQIFLSTHTHTLLFPHTPLSLFPTHVILLGKLCPRTSLPIKGAPWISLSFLMRYFKKVCECLCKISALVQDVHLSFKVKVLSVKVRLC